MSAFWIWWYSNSSLQAQRSTTIKTTKRGVSFWISNGQNARVRNWVMKSLKIDLRISPLFFHLNSCNFHHGCRHIISYHIWIFNKYDAVLFFNEYFCDLIERVKRCLFFPDTSLRPNKSANDWHDTRVQTPVSLSTKFRVGAIRISVKFWAKKPQTFYENAGVLHLRLSNAHAQFTLHVGGCVFPANVGLSLSKAYEIPHSWPIRFCRY